MRKRMRADHVLTCVLAVIIFIANIRHIAILNGPYMFNDELGYLGNAAAFAGKDWSDVMRYCSWYSFGWSMVIAPFFALFSSMRVIYRCINVLNALLVVAVFLMLRFLLKKLFKAGNAVMLTVISACACFYPSILVHSSMAWAETWLLFAFMALSLMAWELIQRPKWYKTCAFGALLWYFYVCHNRMLAVVIAGVLLVFALWATKIVRFRDVAMFIVSLFAAYLLFEKLKEFVVARNWPHGMPNDNNLSGGLKRLMNILTPAGAMNFVSVLCSQFLYVCIASCGMVPFGLYVAISKVVRCLREHRVSESAMEIWLSLSFLGIFAVSTIMTGGTDDLTNVRLDHIFYGRYCEPVYIALLAYGIAYIAERAQKKETNVFLTACLFIVPICVWFAYKTMQSLAIFRFDRPNAPGISAYYELFHSESFVFFAVVLSVIVMIILIKLLPCSKFYRYTGLICLCGVFVASGLSAERTILDYQRSYGSEIEFLDTIMDYDIGNKSLYGLGRASVKYYQCMLPDKRLGYVDGVSLSELPEDQFYAIVPKEEYFPYAFNVYADIVANSQKNLFVFVDRSKPNNKAITIPLSMIHLKDISEMDSQGHIKVTRGGLAFYGPYIDLSDGCYELTVDMAIESETDMSEYGKLQAVSVPAGGLMAGTILTREMVNQGIVHVELPMNFKDGVKQVEFYLGALANTTYEVYGMTLSKEYKMDYPLLEQNISSLLSGFSNVEEDGRWMEQNEALIDCYLPDGDYVMTVQLGNHVPVAQLGLDVYEAEVYMNDVLLGTIELRQDAQSEWYFNVSEECLEDGGNMLAFQCKTLWTPSEYGSTDMRELGLSINSVTFEPVGE